MCGFKNIRLLYKKDKFNILKCNNCGFLFNEKWEELSDEANISISKEFNIKTMIATYENEKILYFDRFSKELMEITKIKKSGRILDIGSSYGYFLVLAKRTGFEPYGVDIDKNEVDFCKIYLGLNVHYGSLNEHNYPQHYFDVITLFHVLEHIPDFNKTISVLKTILKPDGLIVIDVPNANDIRRIVLRQNWPMFQKHHLWYFSLSTLYFLMHKYCFEIFRVHLHGGSQLVYLLDKKLKIPIPIPKLVVKLYKYARPIKNFLSYILNHIGFSEDITVYARNVTDLF